MSEANKELVRRYTEEFWGQGKTQLAEDLFPQNIVYRDPFGFVKGRENLKEYVRESWANYQKWYFRLDQVMAENDMAIGLYTFGGTKQGSYYGVEPPQRQLEYQGISLNRIETGRIVETRCLFDRLEELEKLGLAVKVTSPE